MSDLKVNKKEGSLIWWCFNCGIAHSMQFVTLVAKLADKAHLVCNRCNQWNRRTEKEVRKAIEEQPCSVERR